MNIDTIFSILYVTFALVIPGIIAIAALGGFPCICLQDGQG